MKNSLKIIKCQLYSTFKYTHIEYQFKLSIQNNLVSSTNSDAYFQVVTQAFSISESTASTQTPNLSCSFSGSTSIIYSKSSYNGAIIPSFVSIDSATGVLTITSPSVSSSTTYSFYIDSTVSGMSEPVQKIINLTVKKCTVSNCLVPSLNPSPQIAVHVSLAVDEPPVHLKFG